MKTLFCFTLALLPALASAEVQIYGKLKSGIETSQTRFNGKTFGQTNISDFGSRIGLRGSLPLGSTRPLNLDIESNTPRITWQIEQDSPIGSQSFDKKTINSNSFKSN